MIKVSVVGVGRMGTYHAGIYKNMPHVRLVGLGETDVASAKHAAQKFEVPVYSDYRVLLDKERPNVVSVTTPASLHEEITIAALQSGAHVIVEKPIATTVEAAARMIRAAHECKRQLMVGNIERFSSVVQKLKTELRLYDLGEIRKITCRRFGPFPERIHDVGVVLDTAVHELDLIIFLTNQIPSHIYAEVKYQLINQHEDTLIGKLYFEKGFSCLLDANWTNPRKTRETVIKGDFGLYYADHIARQLVFHPKGKHSITYPLPYYDPLEIELRSFLDMLNDENTIEGNLKDSVYGLYLALTLLESGKTARSQKIDFDVDAFMNNLPGNIP